MLDRLLAQAQEDAEPGRQLGLRDGESQDVVEAGFEPGGAARVLRQEDQERKEGDPRAPLQLQQPLALGPRGVLVGDDQADLSQLTQAGARQLGGVDRQAGLLQEAGE